MAHLDFFSLIGKYPDWPDKPVDVDDVRQGCVGYRHHWSLFVHVVRCGLVLERVRVWAMTGF